MAVGDLVILPQSMFIADRLVIEVRKDRYLILTSSGHLTEGDIGMQECDQLNFHYVVAHADES